jgi:hypothetical protein
MRDQFTPVNDATFDRLVDDELSVEERGRLLAALDDRPGGWRQCALAFLEAQAWRRDLGMLSAERPTQTAIPTQLSRVTDDVVNRNTARSAANWFALAACVLVAFGLGTLWQFERGTPRVATTEVPRAVAELAQEDSKLPPASPTTSSPDALTLWVRDHTGTPQRLHVPLVDAGGLDQRLGVQFRSALPDSLRAHLRASGYDVHSTRRYAPLALEDGGSLVVPVEDTRIVPMSAEVY